MKTLRTCYNLAFNPASWDFTVWLVIVEMARIRHGYDNFTVYFKPGPKDGFRDDNLDRPIEQRRMILENVIKPALRLFDAEETSEAGGVIFPHMMRDVVKGFKNGEKVPHFRIPQSAKDEAALYLKGRKPLILTLREAVYYPQRNSNLEAWQTFARECGEDIIFVRDTAKADERLAGFETCPRASKDFMFRGALMEAAKCNLLVAGGAIGFCWFSSTPFLMFGALRDMPDYSPATAEWWRSKIAIDPGTNVPWAVPGQRIVWDLDSAQAIRSAWEQLNERLAA